MRAKYAIALFKSRINIQPRSKLCLPHLECFATNSLINKENIEKISEILISGGDPVLLDPLFFLRVDAARESADFIKENMEDAVLFTWQDAKEKFWSYSLSLAQNEGLFLEFGVASGRSINYFAELRPECNFHGFDSFEGLPEDWNGWNVKKGAFARKSLPQVRQNVTLHKGWFDQSLPEFLRDNHENVAFLHVDCDLYSSAKCIFEQLADRIVPGTVIVFDELLNYPGWKMHEYKAFQEFVKSCKITCIWKAFFYHKATVIITEKNLPNAHFTHSLKHFFRWRRN